jgi:hypothetical protein
MLLMVAEVVRQSVNQLHMSFLKLLMIWLKPGAQNLKSMFNSTGSNSTVDKHLSLLDITQSKLVYIAMNVSEKACRFHPGDSSWVSWTLKMEAASSSKTLVYVYQFTRRHYHETLLTEC